MFLLRVEPPGRDPFEVQVEGEPLVLGRSSQADVSLPDRFLSRQHARIVPGDQGLTLEDLGSRNGTLVNGRRVVGSLALSGGDIVQLSACRVTVVERTTGPRPAPVADADAGLQTVYRSAAELVKMQSEIDTNADADAGTLRRVAERLRLLNDVHQAIASSMSIEDLLELMLERLFEHLGPEEGVVFLKDEASGEYRRAASRSSGSHKEGYLYSQTLIREVSEKRLAALVLDTAMDARFAEAQSILESGVRSLVAAPLLHPGGSLGMIVLNSRLHQRRFDEEDMNLLASLSSAAALRIQNLSLMGEAAERKRMEEELALARRIQEALLPAELPAIDGLEIYAINRPSRGVSGDFYQVLAGGDESPCTIVLADVSGKGMAASLLTATLEALLGVLIGQGFPPETIFERLSALLYARTPPEKFATAFLARLDPATGEMSYASAGHNPTLIVRAAGEVEELERTGLPLGLLPVATYVEATARLDGGDSLVVYTDGITEPENADEEEYDLPRLIEVCRRECASPPAALAGAIEADLEAFVSGLPYPDDRTLVILRRTAGPAS